MVQNVSMQLHWLSWKEEVLEEQRDWRNQVLSALPYHCKRQQKEINAKTL